MGKPLFHLLRYGGKPHGGAKRERTIAVTWGPYGGVWFAGKRGVIWRLCLGFIAITYIPTEMTEILNAWLNQDEYDGPIPRGKDVIGL